MRDVIARIADALARRDAGDVAGESETLFVLMQQHNMKEEGVLYPMCDARLAAEAQMLVERIEQLVEGVRT
jgi:iron-sulfur cluster repair protein YtfE (RIC family)